MLEKPTLYNLVKVLTFVQAFQVYILIHIIIF